MNIIPKHNILEIIRINAMWQVELISIAQQK